MYEENNLRQCPYCPYQTEKASTFSMHLSMKHGSKKKHACPECNLRFSQKTQLEHHFINHHCGADIECPEPNCTMKFKTHTNVKTHYVRKHMDSKLYMYKEGDYYVCSECEYSGKSAAMCYHIAHCSPDSPFYNTTNTYPIKRRRLEDYESSCDEIENQIISTPLKLVNPVQVVETIPQKPSTPVKTSTFGLMDLRRVMSPSLLDDFGKFLKGY